MIETIFSLDGEEGEPETEEGGEGMEEETPSQEPPQSRLDGEEETDGENEENA